MTNTNPLITILGPTASGKTSLAAALAKEINGEIISADSRQVYRSMDIGTGKDLSSYEDTPYHLIDIVDAGDQYDLAEFQEDFKKVLKEIRSRGNFPILCGGSGMYIQAVLQEFKFPSIPKNDRLRSELELLSLDELKRQFETIALDNPYPTNPSSKKHFIRAIETIEWQKENEHPLENPSEQISHLIFGLNPKVDVRRERISNRLKNRLDEGLLEEVESLIAIGIAPEKLIYYGLEYKWATLYLEGKLDYSEFYTQLETGIHRFAKRQMTYFRKMEKDSLKIEWLDWQEPLDKQIDFIKRKVALLD